MKPQYPDRGGEQREILSIASYHQEAQAREHPSNHIQCDECKRFFRRESDKKCHKCILERQKPVHKQRGAVQCTVCHRWFRSHGELAVHKCRPDQANEI